MSYLFSSHGVAESLPGLSILLLLLPLVLAWSTLYTTSLVRRLRYGGSLLVARTFLAIGWICCIVCVFGLVLPNAVEFVPVYLSSIGLTYFPIESSRSGEGLVLDLLFGFLFLLRGILLGSLWGLLSVKPLNWKRLESRVQPLRVEASIQSFLWLTLGLVLLGGLSIFVLPLTVMLVWSYVGGVRARQVANERLSLILLHGAIVDGRSVTEHLLQRLPMSERSIARSLKSMITQLERGESVAMAAGASGLLSNEIMLEVAAGEEARVLPETLEKIVERIDRSQSGGAQFDLFLMQLMTLGAVVISVVGYLMYNIIPKFKKIFDDFDMVLPPVTVALIEISDLVVSYYYVTLPAVYLIGHTILASVLSPRFYHRMMWKLRKRLGIRWGTPLVLRSLRVAIAADRPATEGLFAISDATVGSALGNRLHKVISSVRRGADLWEELLRQRIIRPAEYQSLSLAQRLGNLPWVLETLADQHVLRSQNRRDIWIEWTKPLAYVVLSVGIGWIAFAIYLPLVTMVNALS